MSLPLDTLILGGGAAGLWLLDNLTRHGHSALLLEANALGHGQTVASQGIIHGGLKYSLAGLLTDSADAIKHLPQLWRDCLAGRARPDLSHTALRSEFCHLWSTDSIMSRLGKLGASLALTVKPTSLPREEWPQLLTNCAGSVSRLDEQVIVPTSFVADLASQHRHRILKIDAVNGLRFDVRVNGRVSCVTLTEEATHRTLEIQPKSVVLCAGQGNATLRTMLGLSAHAMQRRSLHVTMARGPLPWFNGHCVDGGKTRITITSDTDSQGRTIWQLGGQVSEDGVAMERGALIAHVKKELFAVMPDANTIDFSKVQWSTYCIDRAEGAMRNHQRPADAVILHEGNVITCWPTKLVLAPQASQRIRALLPAAGERLDVEMVADWPRPTVALPPWESERDWIDG